MISDLVQRNRSYRRFNGAANIARETLVELVDLARRSPSGGNIQPLKFILSCDPTRNNMIFSRLKWAGYLTEWEGPEEGERPSGYIIILGDREVSENFGCDHGIAAQSILLGAIERGLGGCIIGSIKRRALRQALLLPPSCEILLVIALGEPREEVVLEEVAEDDIKYWRDEKGVHHVPKRPLDELIIDG
ncbi:MAG: nitroreductase family protein [bacterium]|nr:nitroreductase family protein [bacterium]